MSEGRLADCYDEGVKDYKRGRNRSPYEPLTPEDEVWERGWFDAQCEAAQCEAIDQMEEGND